MHLTGCTFGCGEAPPPRPPPFDPASPPGSHAPSRLSLGARGALALALGPHSGPHASVPLPVPWVPPPVTHALACLLAHRPPLRSMHLTPCLGPCAPFPCPGFFPAPRPVWRRPLPALCPPLLLLASVPRLCLRRCSLPLAPWPAPCACPWALPLSPPVPRSAFPWLARSSACAPFPPSRITRRSSRCLCSCDSVTPGGERSGARGADVPRPPWGEGLGGERFGGAGVAVGEVGAGAVLCALPAHCCCCGRRWRGARGPCGVRPPLSWRAGGRGVASRGSGVARRGRGCNPSRTLPAPLRGCRSPRDATSSCAGATPRVGGVPGAVVGAAAWLAGAAVSAPRASGAPSRGGAAGLAVGAAGAVTSAGSGCWVDGSVSAEAARGCPAGGPTGTAASASSRSSRSAGVSPVHSGETGERERDPRWWRSSRWGEPSESDITVILVGVRRGRCALPTHSCSISVVPWAVLCSALRGGGGEGVGGRLWREPRTGGGWRPSIGIKRGGRGATRPARRATAPSLGRGSGPWEPGGRQVVPGGAALGGPP